MFLQPTFKVNTPLYISLTCKEKQKKEKEILVIADTELSPLLGFV